MLAKARIALQLARSFMAWTLAGAAVFPLIGPAAEWADVTNNVGGDKWGADGVDVDFGDPERKTLLLGLHEQSQSVQLSTDGGQSWKKIGDKLPADSNHSSDPVLIDSKTFLVNTAGWKQKATLGIYRTEDA